MVQTSIMGFAPLFFYDITWWQHHFRGFLMLQNQYLNNLTKFYKANICTFTFFLYTFADITY